VATAAGGVSGQRKGRFGQQKKGHMPESPPRRYFVCNRPGHLAKDCYQCVGAPAAQRGGSRGAGSYSHQFGSRGNRGGAHVKLCTTREPVRTVRMQDCNVQCEEQGHCGLTETSWEFGDYPIVKSVMTYSPCPQVRVFPLQ